MEGTGRVEACEPRRRLLLVTRHMDAQDEGIIEVTLSADAHLTNLAWEERGMPLEYLVGYGAGIQVSWRGSRRPPRRQGAPRCRGAVR